MLYTLNLTIITGNNITSSESIKEYPSKWSSCMICLMLQYLSEFMRFARISMSVSSTCLTYDISRTNTSVSFVRTKIFLWPLLFKFNVCLSSCWSGFSASYGRAETWASNSEQKEEELLIYCDVSVYVAIIDWSLCKLQIFVQFILVLVVFKATFSHVLKDFSRISFK